MNRTLQYVIHVFGPLFVGAWIYVSWRSPNLLVFDWLYALNIDPTPIRTNREIPHFIEYCLPDGCWVYAGTSWMLLIWRRISLWVYLYLALGVGGELGQLMGIVPGTFEMLDIVACVFGFLVPLLVLSKCRTNTSGQLLLCS
jgi:hypothetical protein